MSDPETTPPAAPPVPPEPDDADDLRGMHFRELLRSPLTWFFIVAGSLAVGAFVAVLTRAGIGAVAFAITFLIALWITFKVADSRAADDFFEVYSRKRSLSLGGKTSLPGVTPLLRKGDEQYAERTLTGQIAPGVDGLLAIYTYVTESTDSDGNRDKQYHPYTLGMSDVPECVDHVAELYCQRRSGFRALEGLEDVFRVSNERVALESEKLADEFEIFCRKGQDENWLRQLFSPSFIVWLTESAPERFAFELVDGTLVAYVRGHKEDAADLDLVAAATAKVAGRLRDESAESAGTAG